MKYTYKERVRLARKLKVFLAIFFAAITFFTGKILLDKTFAKNDDYVFFNETTNEGINVSILGEEDALPSDAKLHIERVEDNQEVLEDISTIRQHNVNVLESYIYDIKVLDQQNNEIEPTKPIQILFSNNKIDNENLNTNVYHSKLDENNNIQTEQLIGEVIGDTITTTTDGFSYYTVEFTYNNLTYSIEGDSEVKLSTILEKINLTGEVSEVSGSNNNLFSFEKKNNEWYLISHQAFTSKEWMKVTIDNIVYEITVTDAINYTITYQSGSDGQFEDGSTTNTVSYSLTTDQITKYSHTPNIDDTGLQNSNYANSLSTNEVVTIPGATYLTVDIYYNSHDINYDYLSVWAGNYPFYTATYNRTSPGRVTTDMGAPDNNRLGGSQSGNYIVNGNTIRNVGLCTLTIPGDSVTFGFTSDFASNVPGYGYYAIVNGNEIRTITSGTYKEPIANDNNYTFKEWTPNPNTISTNTTVSAVYTEDLLDKNSKGTYEGVDWKIKYDGTLVIGKAGTTQSYINNSTRYRESWPWYRYRTQITGINFSGIVNGNGSHKEMFFECSIATSINNISNFDTSNVTNMYGIFYKCRSLTGLNVSNFNTSNVTDMGSMFDYCTNLISLDISNFNTSNVTNMKSMFSGCTNLTSLDVSNFNTSNVTDMHSMFSSCRNLISLDVSNFNTSNVTDMSTMFYNCNNLVSLDLSNFSTSDVTDMGRMFYDCNSLTSLDLSNFNTSNVTDMEYMFSNCINLTSLDISNFDTSNVTDMNDMFRNCSNLASLDLSNFNTSNVTNMDMMFFDCSNLTSLDLSNFNTSNVTDMGYMFHGCSDLTSLDLSNFNTSNVTDMGSMFYDCNSLTSLDLSNFNTSNVTTMGYMFYGCSDLTSLDLSNFNTSNVTNMEWMFRDCRNLTSLDISNFNTSNVTTMGNMFENCYSLTSLNLSNFNTSNVTTMGYMFCDCKNLMSLDISNFDTSTVSYKASMLENTFKLNTLVLGESFNFNEPTGLSGYWQRDGDITIYSGEELETNYDGSTMAGTYRKPAARAVLYDNGYLIFSVLSIDPDEMLYRYGVSLGEIVATYTNFESTNYTNYDQVPWHENRNLVQHIIFAGNELLTSPVSTAYWFYGMENVEEINLGGLYTRDVTNMKYMFANCSSLEKIYFTYNDSTSNMSGMQTSLKKVELPSSEELIPEWYDDYSFNTKEVTDMSYMFYNCSSLEFLYLAAFNNNGSSSGEGGTVVSFKANTKMKATLLDVYTPIEELSADYNSTFLYTKNVTTMEKMFSGCTSLARLDIRSFDTTNVTTMDEMFYGTENLELLGLGPYYSFLDNTELTKSWIKNGDSVIYTAEELTSTYDGETMWGIYRSTDSNFVIIYENGEMVFQRGVETDPDKGNVLGVYTGFEEDIYNDSIPTPWNEHVNLITKVIFDTEIKPLSTSYWFAYMQNLTEIENLDFLNTSNVLSMSGMFGGCGNLTEIDVSTFDTSNVRNMNYMFVNCESLINLDLSTFETSNVYSMEAMFSGCSNLQILDISNMNVIYNEITMGMFADTPNLRVLALGENFNFYYYDTDENSGLANSWQRDGDEEVYRAEDLMMSYDGSTMSGIYRKVTPPIPYVLIYDSGQMVFQLGNDPDSERGTVVASYTDFENLNVVLDTDIPWNSNKEDITKVIFKDKIFPTSTVAWFSDMTNLTEIENMENLITSSVTRMYSMFDNCSSLETLDLSTLDTKNVENMELMFANCTSLTSLDLGNFDTEKVTSMNSMFYGCENLTTLDVSNFNTSNVEATSSMFEGCSSLRNLDLSSFDTPRLLYMENMFTGCTSLNSLDIVNFDATYIDSMANAFADTPRLSLLELGEKWHFEPNNGLTKNWMRDEDNTILTAEELTNLYNGETMSGTYLAVSKLTITEEVRGDIADTNKDFNFMISVRDGDVDLEGTIPYAGTTSGNLEFVEGTASFTLKHRESIEMYLPSGNYEYSIDQNSEGYTVSKTNDEGDLTTDKVASFINTLNGTTPTGIILNLIPYLLIVIISTISIIWIYKFRRI